MNLLLLLSFSTRKHTSVASRVILSNFFEEQWIQNHPQYLSGLPLALFPTTFLKIAVCEGCRKPLSIIASNGSVPFLSSKSFTCHQTKFHDHAALKSSKSLKSFVLKRQILSDYWIQLSYYAKKYLEGCYHSHITFFSIRTILHIIRKLNLTTVILFI